MGHKGRILVIDDSPMMLDTIKSALAGAGYDVIATSQTVGAGRHLKECDFVILDYHMPGIDGADVLKSLKAAAASSNIAPRFYLYTSDPNLAASSCPDGFDGVLRKKGDLISLVQQVDAAFRLARLRALTRGA